MIFRAARFSLLCVLCAPVVNCFSLDREAFTFTNYDLNAQIEPEQHRLAVRGKITLRNDSAQPQKNAVLQISSSLDWRSIKAGDKALQFVSQIYTSDIDHTGALSEAIVALPQPIPAKGTFELDIGYEGVIVRDATRLTRIGTPEATANATDWDQISAEFTAVRGSGYVAWYPIATDAANLSEGNNLFDVLGRWKKREAESSMKVNLERPNLLDEAAATLMLCNGNRMNQAPTSANVTAIQVGCTYKPLGLSVPTFISGNYSVQDRGAVRVHFLQPHSSEAENYLSAAEKVEPLVAAWFAGAHDKAAHEKAEVVELPEPGAAPFESGNLLLTRFGNDSKLAQISLAHTLTHASFTSPRPWIYEGLAHFAQALYLEQQSGRQAALDYMGLHRAAFVNAEKPDALPRSEDAVDHSLINTTIEELYRGKAMYVWWMLRDMIGEAALKKALAAYHPDKDKEPSYLPHLIAAQTPRDLEWFLDDWIFRDRGLPDFRVVSAFPRRLLPEGYMVTITVENLGAAGAEVPVTVRFKGGAVTKRLEVRGKNKAVTRVEVPQLPQEIVVNDGSVPESDTSNNTFKIQTEESK